MATLEQQRRAIGAANEAARRGLGRSNEAARRAIGTSNEAARRGIGTSLEAQRRGTSVIDDLNYVVSPVQQGRVLQPLESRGARSAARGVADYKAPSGAKGGGIASPLKEVPGTVEYWAAGWLSSDGLFVLPAPKKRTFTDANGDPAVFEFANPAGTA